MGRREVAWKGGGWEGEEWDPMCNPRLNLENDEGSRALGTVLAVLSADCQYSRMPMPSLLIHYFSSLFSDVMGYS